MKPTTIQYLRRAAEDRELAQTILATENASPVLVRWGAVIAFYTAVHYVNAALEEQLAAPRNHAERRASMELLRDLRSVLPQYEALNQLGWAARYIPSARVTRAALTTAIQQDLEDVRIAALAHLPVDDVDQS
jgi:hypothetical protein